MIGDSEFQPAERVVEKIEIKDVENVKEFQVTQLIPEVQVLLVKESRSMSFPV